MFNRSGKVKVMMLKREKRKRIFIPEAVALSEFHCVSASVEKVA